MNNDTLANAASASYRSQYESRGPTVLVVTIIFTVLSFTFTLLRSLSRLFLVGRWKLDDWFIVLAWLLAFGFSFSICWAEHSGLGRHGYDVPLSLETPLRRSEYAFSVLYNPVLVATKTSICLFYLSIAKNQRFFRWGVWITLIVVSVAGIALTLVNAFQCSPPGAIIAEEIPKNAVCLDQIAIYLASAPVNIATDLALLVLPMPMLTAMRMPRKQKVILLVTFGFGLFGTVVDIVRIAYLQDAFEQRIRDVTSGNVVTSELLNVQNDFPWYAAYSFMWSAIEVHIGIMCANVPGLKPLAAKLLPTIIYDTQSQMDGASWRRRRPRNFFKRGGFCFFKPGKSRTGSSDVSHASPIGRLYGRGSIQQDARRTSSVAPINPELHLAHVRSHDFAGDPEYNATTPPGSGSSDERRPSTLAAVHENRSSGTGRSSLSPAGQNDDHPMDFLEFITAPDNISALSRRATIGTVTTMSPSTDPNPTFLDFYNIGNRKCMTELTDRESLFPNALVTILFFLWGLSYGFLSQLNTQFEIVAGLNTTQSVALHSAYYGAYLIAAPTVGQFVLRKVGFKMTFICGLCIYGTGTLIFWPSAVLISFPAFLVSNFVVGFGVAVLESSANPFVALCGSSKYAETRLNISQGIQAIGTVIAPPLAQKVFFKDAHDVTSLVDIQWAYLAIALFDVALAVMFYYVPLPEASDEDFEAIRLLSLPEDRRIDAEDRKIPRHVYATLAIAAFAMFAYVGGQEVIAVNFIPFGREVHGETKVLSAADWQTISYGTFAIGRFATAALTAYFPPWTVLGFLYAGVIVFSSLSIGLKGITGDIMLVMYELFQGGIFPLIYAIGLRGLGRHTKWGAVILTAAISGGAIWPLMSAGVNAVRGYQIGNTIAIAAMALGALYPLYLGIYGPARHMVDPKNSAAGRSVKRKAKREKEGSEGRSRATDTSSGERVPPDAARRAVVPAEAPALDLGADVTIDFEKELEEESKKPNLTDLAG